MVKVATISILTHVCILGYSSAVIHLDQRVIALCSSVLFTLAHSPCSACEHKLIYYISRDVSFPDIYRIPDFFFYLKRMFLYFCAHPCLHEERIWHQIPRYLFRTHLQYFVCDQCCSLLVHLLDELPIFIIANKIKNQFTKKSGCCL